jgi:hypothetical protein
MNQWSTLRRALLFCLPGLATGLFMDQWGLRSVAWLFVFVALLVACLFAGLRTIAWLASPKGSTRTHPALVYMTAFSLYALTSALFGDWWVEYRLTSLCEHLQNQIRTFPQGAKPESLLYPSTHRLIFTHATVTHGLDAQNGITFLIQDQRGLLFSGYYVNANEIRNVSD